MLACRNLTVRPRVGAAPLVHNTTARFGSGGLHALIGPSGCGKTTLLKGILDILPAEGEILLRGRPLVSRDALLREVSAGFKSALRMEDTVARFGGDEFAILQAGCAGHDGPAASPAVC